MLNKKISFSTGITIVFAFTVIVGVIIFWQIIKWKAELERTEPDLANIEIERKKESSIFEAVFHSACLETKDFWVEVLWEEKEEECDRMLNDNETELAERGFTPEDCKLFKAENEDCDSGGGSRLRCLYNCND